MTPKYAGDSDPSWHGAGCRLHYPGTADGYPIRTNPGSAPPPLKEHEYRKLPVVVDAKVAVFNTWEPESMRRYEELLDRIMNGQFFLYRRTEPKFVDEKQGWTWLVEWMQPYGVLPNPNYRQP